MTDLNRSSLVTIAHVHGADALAVTTGHLRATDIPVFADIAHFANLHPHLHTALGGIAISVPRSKAVAARETLECAAWVSRPLSKRQIVLWVALMIWAFVPPLSSSVFVLRSSRSTGVMQQGAS
ncbi:MAG: hypothetical protein ABJ360_17320 [Roseobacter sp.]